MSFKPRYLARGIARNLGQSRNALALLALAVAIATLMQVLALRAGTRQQLQTLLADTGANMLTVSAELLRALPGRSNSNSMARTLKPADVSTMRSAAGASLLRLAAVSTGTRRAEFREESVAVTVTGTEPDYFALRRYVAAQGRLLQILDQQQVATVAVLGAQVAALLFGDRQQQVLTNLEQVGRSIRIGGIPFTVVGILQARGSGQAGSQDDGIYIPLSTAQRRLFNVDYYNSVMMELDSVEAALALQMPLAQVLRDNHQLPSAAEADFKVQDAARALAAAQRNQLFAASFFQGFAALTLTMAATGIVAITQLNVKERESEFGLRRAVGAGSFGIVALVLLETLLLGLGGGISGVGLGLLVLYALRFFTDWVLVADSLLLLQGIAAALALSMLAAVIPAWTAASRDPLAALNRL